MMWWVPIVTAGVVALLMSALHMLHRRSQLSGARAYRSRFVQLVAQLDAVTMQVNMMVAQVKALKDPKILDYYESSLRILEALLTAMRKIPPFGTDTAVLDSAVFLVRDCRQRVGRLQKVCHDARAGLPLQLDELYGSSGEAVGRSRLKVSNCYFCSRPVLAEQISQVKVRVDGTTAEVISCAVCRAELAATRRVKILHFMQENRPVHWSLVKDYQPSDEYWSINSAEVKSRRLELVHPTTEAHRSD